MLDSTHEKSDEGRVTGSPNHLWVTIKQAMAFQSQLSKTKHLEYINQQQQQYQSPSSNCNSNFDKQVCQTSTYNFTPDLTRV